MRTPPSCYRPPVIGNSPRYDASLSRRVTWMVRTVEKPAVLDHQLPVSDTRDVATIVDGRVDRLLYRGVDNRAEYAAARVVAAAVVLRGEHPFPQHRAGG